MAIADHNGSDKKEDRENNKKKDLLAVASK
jgi:hypothetical protein